MPFKPSKEVAIHQIIEYWREGLSEVLEFYESKRGHLAAFFSKLLVAFILINIVCYWLALFTAFPEHLSGPKASHYFLIQFPVGILGALFDSFSFFVTVWIVRRAVRSRESMGYIAHIGLDFLVAVLATFWVVGVFSVSGWFISQFEAQPEEIVQRTAKYKQWMGDAVAHPRDNLKQIYFTLVMGISASLPSCVHIYLLVKALYRHHDKKRTDRGKQVDPVRRLGRWGIALACVAIGLTFRTCNLTERTYDIATTADYRAQVALQNLQGIEQRPRISARPTRLASGGFSELVRHGDGYQLRMVWDVTNGGYVAAKNVQLVSVLRGAEEAAECTYTFSPIAHLPAQERVHVELKYPWTNESKELPVTDLVYSMRTTATCEGEHQSDLSYSFTVNHKIRDYRIYESYVAP